MIRISPAILHDASVYIYKAGSKFNGRFVDFFSANRDLFHIKTPHVTQKFIEALNLSTDMRCGSLISIKKVILIKYIKAIDPPWRNRICWGIKLEVFEHLKERHPNLYRCLKDCYLISEKHSAIIWWYENLAYNKDSTSAVIGAKERGFQKSMKAWSLGSMKKT